MLATRLKRWKWWRKLRRRSPTAAKTLSWSEELSDIPDQPCTPERPCTRESIQQLNSRSKRKRRFGFLLLSLNQLVATRMVVPEWSNFAKCLGITLLKMCLRNCWVMARNRSVSTWGSCVPASLLGLFWASSRGATQARGSFSWSSWAVACYLWLGLCPSIEFLCVEHTRNLSLPPPPKSISVVWKSWNISLTRNFKKKLRKARHQEGEIFNTEREIRNHRTAQGWSESCGLTNSVKNQSCPSAPGLPPLCVCSHKWNLPSQSSILNFLQRT